MPMASTPRLYSSTREWSSTFSCAMSGDPTPWRILHIYAGECPDCIRGSALPQRSRRGTATRSDSRVPQRTRRRARGIADPNDTWVLACDSGLPDRSSPSPYDDPVRSIRMRGTKTMTTMTTCTSTTATTRMTVVVNRGLIEMVSFA